MVDIDDDTLQAVRALWLESPGLPAIVDRPPAAGDLKSPRAQPLPLPYAAIACEGVPGKVTRYLRGRKDVRKVTISVWGTYTQATAALAAVLLVFNRQMGPGGGAQLAFPSNARLIKWWPLNDGDTKQEDAVKAGQDVWRAWVEAEVYTARPES